ncbi:MAG: hypothetical protein Q8Q95_03245 [bacterium]|nr:hypothetical protein [bacterium]
MFEKKIIVRNNNQEELLWELKNKSPHIVGVDGETGVGKSTKIAQCIRDRFGGIIVSVDNYLEKDKGEYIDYINYRSLCQDLSTFAKQSEPLIIEGIMLLDILEKVDINQDYLIYACRSMWLDDWTGEYGNYFNCGSLEEIIKQQESIVKIIDPKYRMGGGTKEIYEYTHRQKPFLRADAIWIFDVQSSVFNMK